MGRYDQQTIEGRRTPQRLCHELEHGLDRETFGRIREHKPARPYRLIAAPGNDVHGACVEVVLLALVGKVLRRRPGGLNHVLIAEAVHGVTVRR